MKTSRYDWFSLINGDIRNKYTVTVRNEFDRFHETSERFTPNDKYKNFVTTHREAVGECISAKPRAKCRVLRVAISVRGKKERT